MRADRVRPQSLDYPVDKQIHSTAAFRRARRSPIADARGVCGQSGLCSCLPRVTPATILTRDCQELPCPVSCAVDGQALHRPVGLRQRWRDCLSARWALPLLAAKHLRPGDPGPRHQCARVCAAVICSSLAAARLDAAPERPHTCLTCLLVSACVLMLLSQCGEAALLQRGLLRATRGSWDPALHTG